MLNDTEILTLQECSSYLKIPESTLYLLAREGRLPGQKIGKQWRFRKESLDKWLDGSKLNDLVNN